MPQLVDENEDAEADKRFQDEETAGKHFDPPEKREMRA